MYKAFKPNKNNTGSLFSAQLGFDNKSQRCFYLSIVKQDDNSWNGKTGSFSRNARDRSNKYSVSIKINEFEAAGMLECIKTYGRYHFSAFHDSGGGETAQISMSATKANKEGQGMVFFFSVKKNNEDFRFTFYHNEATALSIFLEEGVREYYRNAQEQNDRRFRDLKQKVENNRPKRSPDPEPRKPAQQEPEKQDIPEFDGTEDPFAS